MPETQELDENRASGHAVAGAMTEASARRPYAAPRILSAEHLEAAAATCDGSGGFGKTVPIPCGTLGS